MVVLLFDRFFMEGKDTDELFVAYRELSYRHDELEKCAADLGIANRKLSMQNEDKKKRAAELIIANKELAFQNKEKEKRAVELAEACEELRKSEISLIQYILGLEEMMFLTSHKVRQSITNILGVSEVIDKSINSPEELRKLVGYLKDSATSLDVFTRDLTTLMSKMEKRVKMKGEE